MFQVPQFVEVEGKILGPLSLRQFLIIGGTMMVGILLYFVMKRPYWIMLMIFLVIGSGVLTFVKINGQPLIRFSGNILGYFWQPRYYIWKKEEEAAAAGPRVELLRLRPIMEKMRARESPLQSLFLKLKTGDNRLSSRMKNPKASIAQLAEGYEVVRKVTGDREIAKRVDYRY